MIYIDFQGGSHGNYLEFVCNKFIGNVKSSSNPFNLNGASHNKIYYSPLVFKANHYFHYGLPDTNKIISIRVNADDLLPFSAISLLRAGNFGYDNNELEINTYNKLSIPEYKTMLEILQQKFFKGQLVESYNAVKDSSWPAIHTLKDYSELPDYIREECKNIHKLELFEFNEEHPNVPRHVLREFFKFGFKNPTAHGFMQIQETQMIYNKTSQVYNFPYSVFYDTDKFLNELEKVAKWTGFDLIIDSNLLSLHSEFLDHQPYKDLKEKNDCLLERLYNKEIFDLPRMNLLEEAYINAHIELHFNKEILTKDWFRNSKEIYERGY